jgi:hypothetical protein
LGDYKKYNIQILKLLKKREGTNRINSIRNKIKNKIILKIEERGSKNAIFLVLMKVIILIKRI